MEEQMVEAKKRVYATRVLGIWREVRPGTDA